MKREKILNTIGLCLLAACFLFALFRVFGRGQGGKDDNRTVIRFAHWQLEGGLRSAFEELARDYEKLHPDVRVEQIAVPERTYAQWVKTQLVGGTAPDIIQLGRGTDDESVARYFRPLSDAVSQPNPYNAGTPLEGVPLRETTIDGMVSSPSYLPNLLEHYGIAVSMFTMRMYYNRDLWRQVLGDTPEPATYDEFQALFTRIEDYNRRTGRNILPIAGSKANAPMLINTLLQNQTQRLVQEKIAGPTLRTTGTEIGLGLLRGEWTLEDTAFTDALTIARETGLRMQPGFLQLGREDATFYFVQGNALMITTGSWDSPSFRSQVNFEIGIFPIPMPAGDHPRYGRNLYGPSSEAETGTGLAFGVTRLSPTPGRATDFLLFLASHPYNTRFTQLSGWLPSIVGVSPPADVAPFLPREDGYVPGFDLGFGALGANSQRVTDTAMNRLHSPQGSVDAFREIIAAELPVAIAADVRRNARQLEFTVTRQDIALLAYLGLQARRPEDGSLKRKIDEVLESQHSMESTRTRNLYTLEQLEAERK